MKQIRGISFPDGDTHFAKQLAVGPLIDGKGTYQYGKYQAALKHVRDRGHAVDVGAHVGLWSRVMAMDFERVTAFEPLPAHRECFAQNVQASNVELVPCALGDQSGTVHIHMPQDNTGHAHVLGQGEACQVKTLDSMELPFIDFLKIDVEGFERPVVLGGVKTIREHRPVIVIEQKYGNAERYGHRQWDAIKILKAWGMREAQVINGDHIMVW